MKKAKPLDRLELTRRKMAFREAMKHADEVPAYPGAEETNEQIKTHDDGKHCPVCGAELRHVAGCLECPNKCYSKCG